MSLFGHPNVEEMKAKRDVKGLIKALTYQNYAAVREDAAKALGEIGNPRAVEPLAAALVAMYHNQALDAQTRQKHPWAAYRA